MARQLFAKKIEGEDGTFIIEGVEIFKTGNWKGRDWDEDDLQQMQDSFTALNAEIAPGVKLGHIDSIEGGIAAPRFGTVINMYRQGKTLLADFARVPGTVADLIEKGAYPRVSVELWYKFKNAAGEVFRNVIDAVALLGSELPEVTTLEDVMALYGKDAPEGVVMFDRENRDVELIEFSLPEGELTDSEYQMELHNRIRGIPAKFGILTDAVEQEEIEGDIRELQWKAQDLVMQILQGEGDYVGLSTDEKKNRIAGILDELESEIQTLAGNFNKSRDDGTEQTEAIMPEEEKVVLSRLQEERDEFERKAKEAEEREQATKDELAELRFNKITDEAKAEAKAFFDGISDKVLPAERLVAEPMLADAIASTGSETPMTFQKDDEAVGVADGIKAMFSLRNDLPDELFQQMLDTADPETLRKQTTGSTDQLNEKAEAYMKDNETDYVTALKFVRRENPELAKAADAETVPMFDPHSEDNSE